MQGTDWHERKGQNLQTLIIFFLMKCQNSENESALFTDITWTSYICRRVIAEQVMVEAQ